MIYSLYFPPRGDVPVVVTNDLGVCLRIMLQRRARKAVPAVCLPCGTAGFLIQGFPADGLVFDIAWISRTSPAAPPEPSQP